MEGDPNIEKSYPHILNLFELSEGQVQALHDRIERWGGVVRVFIHPETMDISGEKNSSIMLNLMYSEKDTPPLIMFNDERYAQNYAETLGQYSNKFSNDMYLVQTLPNYPYPVINDERLEKPVLEDRPGGILSEEDVRYTHEVMSRIVNIFKVLGVKRILIGGRDLEEVNGDINRCVGNFIRWVKELSGIEVKVSLATEGNLTRDDIRTKYPDLL